MSRGIFGVANCVSLRGTAGAAVRGGPPGTYLETCRDVRIDGDRLWARCEKADGNWRDTSLDDVYRCVGDIANVDGRLVCQKAAGPPQGDYARTCRDIRMRFNSLYARCQTRDGYWVETQLDGFSRCHGPIANVDGQLRRGDPDWDRDRHRDRDRAWGYGPPGSHRETSRDIRFEGDRLRARGEGSDGDWFEPSLAACNRSRGGTVN